VRRASKKQGQPVEDLLLAVSDAPTNKDGENMLALQNNVEREYVLIRSQQIHIYATYETEKKSRLLCKCHPKIQRILIFSNNIRPENKFSRSFCIKT
jgi:hypothetical protein